jgi:hypothetical protein
MTRISNADQVLLLLQEQISRLEKTRSNTRVTASRRSGTPEPMARVRGLTAHKELSEDDLKRALVRGLLVQQLGDAIGNDPAFEAVANDVIRIIGDTQEGRDLLDRALLQLGSAPSI